MTKQTASFLKKKIEEQAKVRLDNQTFALVAIDGEFCGLAGRQEKVKMNDCAAKGTFVEVESVPKVWVHYTRLVIEEN